MSRPFAPIEDAIADIRAGKMVVVCDDEDRENEGDLTIAAEFATPAAINFMAREGRGLICLALTPERCDELGLDLMAAKNESAFETAFTVTVEAREGVTTGISAADLHHGERDAVDRDRALLDHVAQQLGRRRDGHHAGEAVVAHRAHRAEAVDVPLDDVPAQPVRGAQRELQVHARALGHGGDPAEVGDESGEHQLTTPSCERR